jgi:hypothetical protein
VNIKNKTYMQNSEFKERQGSFGFYCAQAAEFLIKFRNECRKGWDKMFKGAEAQFENITLPLFQIKASFTDMMFLNEEEWQKRNLQVTLFPTTKGA